MEALEPLRLFSIVVPTYTEQPLDDWNYGGIPADWDNDGDIDLVAYSFEGKLIGGQQQADGTILQYEAGNDALGRGTSAAADIDMDGDLDLLSVTSPGIGQRPDQVIWQFNDGTGRFTDGGSQLLPAYPLDCVPTDLDRDGDPDLAMLYSNISTQSSVRGTALLYNDGAGNFSLPVLLDGSGIDTGGSATAADFDGDDDIDLAVPIQSYLNPTAPGAVRILLNDGHNGFSQREDVVVGGRYTVNVVAGDVDNDGDVDLVTARYTSSPIAEYEIVLLLNDGSGYFPAREEISTSGSSSQHFLLSDLNGDSMPDFLDGFNNRVLWNDGNGSLLAPVQLLAPASAGVYDVVDLNGDGRRDSFGFTKVWLASGFTDTLRPVASRPAYVYNPQAGNPALRVDFSEDVRQTLRAADFQLANLTTGQSISTADLKLNYSTGDIASLLLPSSIPDGNYRLNIAATAVADIAGNTLASDFSFDFAVLSGDANRDRKIDAADLGVLSANWQGASKTFAQGDFNYDTKVDIQDLYILASKWQQTLPPPALPAALPTAPASTTPVRRTPTRVASSVLK